VDATPVTPTRAFAAIATALAEDAAHGVPPGRPLTPAPRSVKLDPAEA
jgi:hypothetical protein